MNGKQIFIALIVSFLVSLLLWSNLQNSNAAERLNDPCNSKNIMPVDFSGGILDYGENIYYFRATEAGFGNALSWFRKKHSELELVTVAPNNNEFGTKGYFVIFRPVAAEKLK